MESGTLIAILAFAGVVVTALGGLVGVLFKRIAEVESRVEAAEARAKAAENRTDRLWMWARKLLNLYYTHRMPGAPDPDPLPDDD